MSSKEESGFDKLTQLIKGESDDIREHIDALGNRVDLLERKMDSGFAEIVRRLDTIIQMQLDEHASRIKKLEMASFLTLALRPCRVGRVACLSVADARQYVSPVCCRGTVEFLMQTWMSSSQYTKKSLERRLVALTPMRWRRALSCSTHSSAESCQNRNAHQQMSCSQRKIVRIIVLRSVFELDFKLLDSIERGQKLGIVIGH